MKKKIGMPLLERVFLLETSDARFRLCLDSDSDSRHNVKIEGEGSVADSLVEIGYFYEKCILPLNK